MMPWPIGCDAAVVFGMKNLTSMLRSSICEGCAEQLSMYSKSSFRLAQAERPIS
jgi:hypothetical protein